jgi:hypothetical protein
MRKMIKKVFAIYIVIKNLSFDINLLNEKKLKTVVTWERTISKKTSCFVWKSELDDYRFIFRIEYLHRNWMSGF